MGLGTLGAYTYKYGRKAIDDRFRVVSVIPRTD